MKLIILLVGAGVVASAGWTLVHVGFGGLPLSILQALIGAAILTLMED